MKVVWKVLGGLAILTVFLGVVVKPTSCAAGPGMPPPGPGLGGIAARLIGILGFWAVIGLIWLALRTSTLVRKSRKTPEQRARDNREERNRLELFMAATGNEIGVPRTPEERERLASMAPLERAKFRGKWEREHPGWEKDYPSFCNRWKNPDLYPSAGTRFAANEHSENETSEQ